MVVFLAGRRFEARAGIHAPWPCVFDSAADVGLIETAGDDHLSARAAGERPVEAASGAAVQRACGRVEQKSLGGQRVERCDVEAGRDRNGAPYAQSGGDFRRLTVELNDVESELSG